jgi:hypothetical protein
VYGPSDNDCTGPALQGPVATQLTTGSVEGFAYTPSAAGTYHWIAEYSGDSTYADARSSCSAATTVLAAARVPTTAAPPTTAPPPSPPPQVAAPAPSLRGAPAPPSPTGLPPYDPAAHAGDVVAVQVSAFAALAMVGGGAAAASQGGGGGSSGDGSQQGGDVVFTEVESAEEGLATGGQPPEPRGGDPSWTWRWAGTAGLDRASRHVPERLAPRSPLVTRIIDDAGYLRAMFGSASMIAPILAVVLGVLAVQDVNGHALPPHFGLAVGLAVLGVFDALAGLIGVLVFVAGVVVLGGLSSADAARTLLGLSTLWFAAPLIAGTARPLRRPPTLTVREHWDRTADIVIASLVGAWAVQKVLQGLPGLARLDLPIANQANDAALIVLGALVVRMAIETVAAHWYPARLAVVQPETLSPPSHRQRAAAYLLVLVVFLFAAAAYVGPSWQLYVGGALFIAPKLLQLLEERLPNSPRIYAMTPKGIVQIVLLLFVGAVLGAIVLHYTASGLEAIRDSFVLLSLPGFALALLELIGMEGPERQLGWHYQLLGIPILAVGILLALGIVTF